MKSTISTPSESEGVDFIKALLAILIGALEPDPVCFEIERLSC